MNKTNPQSHTIGEQNNRTLFGLQRGYIIELEPLLNIASPTPPHLSFLVGGDDDLILLTMLNCIHYTINWLVTFADCNSASYRLYSDSFALNLVLSCRIRPTTAPPVSFARTMCAPLVIHTTTGLARTSRATRFTLSMDVTRASFLFLSLHLYRR